MPEAKEAALEQLSFGYARLDALLGKQRNVDKILWLKSADDDVSGLLDTIATTTGEARKRIGKLIGAAAGIDVDRLPDARIDQRTRAAIEATTREELLGAGGVEFEVRMLLSQLEGLRYGAHLARQIAEAEVSEERAEYLRGLAEELEGLRERVFALVMSRVEGVDR